MCQEEMILDTLKKDFYDVFENVYSEDYELMSEYETPIKSVILKHKKCGKSRIVLPLTLRNHRGVCLKCLRKEKKKLDAFRYTSNEIFTEEIIKIYGNLYTVISEFKGLDDDITLKHHCGEEVTAKAKKFLDFSKKCKCEYKSTLKTTQQFKKELNNLTKGQFELIGEYVSSKVKVKLKHKNCEKTNRDTDTFEILPNQFFTYRKCPCCAKRKPTKAYSKNKNNHLDTLNENKEITEKLNRVINKSSFEIKKENVEIKKELTRLLQEKKNLSLISEVRGETDTILIYDVNKNKMVKTTPKDLLKAF